MATVRAGNRKILLIVDAQAGVVQNAWNADRVVANIALAVESARQQSAPVVWVQHTDDELVADTPEWRWATGLSPAEAEPVIRKQYNSAFERTGLAELLAELGATHIVLAGAATNWCIRATAHAALDLGYDLTLVEDAHTTESIELGDGYIIEAEDMVRELNNAMTWLSYPGRTNSTDAAADVVFTTG